SLAELPDEHNGHDIEETVHHALPAKFTVSEFSGLMLDNLFTNTGKSGPFGNNGDVAVHLTVHFDIFNYIEFIGLQTAVKIMQSDTACHTGNKIEKLRRQGFADRILAVFLPTAHQVEVFFPDHVHQIGYLLR